MKLLIDFLPLVLFFLTYKLTGANPEASAAFATHWMGGLVQGGVVGAKEAPVLLATVVVILATLLQVVYLRATRRPVHLLLWISLVVIVVLGGATVWLHNETFIKWKPTVAVWLMGGALWASQALFRRNMLQELMGEDLEMPEAVWRRLNLAWVGYFVAMGVINLWVAYAFSTDTWASFHTFGSTALTLVFMVGQGIYLSKHLPPVPPRAPEAPEARGKGDAP